MADEAPETPKVIPVEVPGVGRVVLVDREKLRRKTDRRFFRQPIPRMGLMAAAPPPEPPTTTDVSKGETIKYPIEGNGTVGDCYYAAALHMVMSFLGQYGTAPTWAESDVIRRYEKLSGGDNGLSDDDIYPEWKRGILGPDGPHKILDTLLIRPTDTHAIDVAIWRFCGVLYTCSLPRGWANNASPGATWDADGTRSVGGHAIILTGKNAKGGYDLRTWGISPPINVTPRGIAANDPEIIVVFSVEQYHPVTHLSSAGFTWEEDRALWITYGGHDVGPAPWGPTPTPVPPAPPSPPTPPVTHGVVIIPDQKHWWGTVTGGTYEVVQVPGDHAVMGLPWLKIIRDGMALAAAVAAQDWALVFSLAVQLANDFRSQQHLMGAVQANVVWGSLFGDLVKLATDVENNAGIQTIIEDAKAIAKDFGINIG